MLWMLTEYSKGWDITDLTTVRDAKAYVAVSDCGDAAARIQIDVEKMARAEQARVYQNRLQRVESSIEQAEAEYAQQIRQLVSSFNQVVDTPRWIGGSFIEQRAKGSATPKLVFDSLDERNRCAAVFFRDVRICAVIEQIADDFCAAGAVVARRGRRDEQWRFTFAVGQVHICSGFHQRPDDSRLSSFCAANIRGV